MSNAAPGDYTVTDWLEISAHDAPLIVTFPHTGTDIPAEIEAKLVSPWLGRKDCDWWIDKLYGFAAGLGATTVRTAVSRTVIDVNRDPSGASLYPGQATTELCPTTCFEGEPLYHSGAEPDAAEIERRKRIWFAPYHEAIQREIGRLFNLHGRVVQFDAHSIRSRISRLFDGELPHINIGTNSGKACAPELVDHIAQICGATAFTVVVDGRFKGGWTTRHYGQPDQHVHAVQIELAQRGYLREPSIPPSAKNWPVDFDEAYAAPMQAALTDTLEACLRFARS